MEHEQVRKVLAEIFDADSKRGRKWFFPKNVEHEYKVFGNMTLKEIGMFVFPSFLLSGGIAAIPPYSSWFFWIIKAIFIAVVIIIPLIYINYRPVKFRNNIRTKTFIKEIIEYKKKQKRYFIKPKDRMLG